MQVPSESTRVKLHRVVASRRRDTGNSYRAALVAAGEHTLGSTGGLAVGHTRVQWEACRDRARRVT